MQKGPILKLSRRYHHQQHRHHQQHNRHEHHHLRQLHHPIIN